MKAIPNYEGLYSVTEDGEVWSHITNKFLKASTTTNGYPAVTLSHGDYKRRLSIHRLVAITYIDNTHNKRTVNHIDGVKTNNHVDNLEWATYSENHKHAFKHGLMRISDKCKVIAKRNALKAAYGNRKLSLDDASEICEAYATGLFSCRELAIPFGVATKTINNLVRGVSYGV